MSMNVFLFSFFFLQGTMQIYCACVLMKQKFVWVQRAGGCLTHVDRFKASILDSDSRFLNHIQVGPSHRQGGVAAVLMREMQLKHFEKDMSCSLLLHVLLQRNMKFLYFFFFFKMLCCCSCPGFLSRFYIFSLYIVEFFISFQSCPCTLPFSEHFCVWSYHSACTYESFKKKKKTTQEMTQCLQNPLETNLNCTSWHFVTCCQIEWRKMARFL